MALDQYKDYEIEEMSMIELAFELLVQDKQPMDFHDLVQKISEVKGMAREEVEERIAQFYTDLNIDGRFIALNENHWGLKRWYPYDPADEDLAVEVKKKKKKKSYYEEDDFEEDFEEDFDEIEEEEDILEEEDIEVDEEDLEDFDEDEVEDIDEYDDELVEEDEYDLGDDSDEDL